MTESIEPVVEVFDPLELQDTILGDVRDPFPALAEARLRGGVQPGPAPLVDTGDPIEIDPGAPIFTAYSHEAVTTILRDPETFSSAVLAKVNGAVMGRTVLEMDGAEHRIHRALISHAFRQKALARWEELVGLVVDELIDGFVNRGRAELVRQLTFPFPVQVIAQILGLPRREYPKFQRWSIEMLSVLVDRDRGMAASQALREYFASVLEDRRRHPREDLISDLGATEIDGRQLSDDEIFAFLRLLLPAGVETTYRSSGNLLYALLLHPDQLASLDRDRSFMPMAIEEGLRWEPPILFLLRQATRDARLGGASVPAGAVLNVCVGSANRDEQRYPQPNEFDIGRDLQHHLTFGFGPHMCIGMHLARMETRIAVTALLDRLPELRLDGDFDRPFVQGTALRSPPALHVRFG